MNELSCHSGTSYDEIWNFINTNLNKVIEFHYELKGFNCWGNDETDIITLDSNGLEFIKNYMGNQFEYRKNGAYVHNIKLVSYETL